MKATPINRARATAVPKHARERNLKIAGDDGEMAADFFIGSRHFAWVYWDKQGNVELEKYYDEQGRQHGVELYRHENGRIKWRSRWRHGKQHGKTQQWDRDGNLLLETRFVNGTGIDVWWDRGRVSEVRFFRESHRHGVEQWWFDARCVFEEGHFSKGQKHGIWRRWSGQRRLERGYPQYFTHDEKVTRREYLKARATDATLPPYSERDNRPSRRLPPEAVAAIVAKKTGRD